MNRKVPLSEFKTIRSLDRPRFTGVFALIIGLSSIAFSCHSNSKTNEKDKLIQRFFDDQIKHKNGKQIFIAVISSDCGECINANIEFIKKWTREKRSITYLIDPKMLVEVSNRAPEINKCSITIDPNIFVKYGITEGRMLVMYTNDGGLEEIDLIPDGVKTYEFRY